MVCVCVWCVVLQCVCYGVCVYVTMCECFRVCVCCVCACVCVRLLVREYGCQDRGRRTLSSKASGRVFHVGWLSSLSGENSCLNPGRNWSIQGSQSACEKRKNSLSGVCG